MENKELKPCPFCGSTKLGLSERVNSRKRMEASYRVAVYCKNCNCYGPRILVKIKAPHTYPPLKDTNASRRLAADAWNNR